MIAYSYDDSFYYIGEYKCQLDPIATRRTGKNVYLIPNEATTVKPPAFTDKQRAVWKGDKWEVEDMPEPEPIIEEEPKEIVLYDDLAKFMKDGVDSTISS